MTTIPSIATMMPSIVYAPYIPIYYSRLRETRRIAVVGVDESSNDDIIFNLIDGEVDLKYNYNINQAYTSTYHVKSKQKLRQMKKLCDEYIECVASNTEPPVASKSKIHIISTPQQFINTYGKPLSTIKSAMKVLNANRIAYVTTSTNSV